MEKGFLFSILCAVSENRTGREKGRKKQLPLKKTYQIISRYNRKAEILCHIRISAFLLSYEDAPNRIFFYKSVIGEQKKR